MSVGILGIGSYVPIRRLQRQAVVSAIDWFSPALSAMAHGERAMAGWDEDSITMAVEAARDCLIDRDRSDIARVLLASTSLPFADRLNAGVVKEALSLPDAVGAGDLTGSQRAGTSALISALESAATAGPILCLASERRLALAGSAAELINGDAAAAVLVGPGPGIAQLLSYHSTTVDFVDHYRASDREHDYDWESRWVRDEGYARLLPEAIGQALDKAGLSAVAVDHLALALPLPGIENAIAKAVGVRADAIVEPLAGTLGYAGAAHPLLLLDRALGRAAPGEIVLLVSFGQGVDVLLFRASETARSARRGLGIEGWLARRRPETNYLKHLYFTGQLRLEEGMRAELDLKTPPSMLYRDRRTILGLIGGKCRETGVVQYPRSDVSVSLEARMVGTQDDWPLADLPASVVTFTADRLAFSPDPPSCYGMIDFYGGGRVLADMVDLDEEGLAVGARVRMMFRLKRRDATGFRHYFWKAAPDFRPVEAQEVQHGDRD